MHRFRSGIEKQFCGQQMLLPDPCRLGNELPEGPRLPAAAQQGQQVHRRVQGRPLVDGAVHVDGHTGDHQQIPVDVHQPGEQTAALPDHHPARHRQRPVQPAPPDPAAVGLHAEPQGIPGGGRLSGLPDLKGGRVAVGRRHQKAVKRPLRHPEGDDRRVSPADGVKAALFQLPGLRLPQLHGSGGLHGRQHIGRRMAAGGAFVQEAKQLL